MNNKKNNEKLDSQLENALNTIKAKKEQAGIIPKNNKKIIIINGVKDFKGKSLRIGKGLFKRGQNYLYKAGTKWEDIDNFGKKNIHFSETDFN